MATLGKVESDVRIFEGFEIRLSGDNVSNKKRLRNYLKVVSRIARNSMTVEKYIALRMEPHYPGVTAQVIQPNGKPAKKQTILSSIRSRYAAHSDN